MHWEDRRSDNPLDAPLLSTRQVFCDLCTAPALSLPRDEKPDAGGD